jgi:IclR family KDG regulon transcriptional repressor
MKEMPTVNAIDRALTILELVGQSKKGLTNSEISRKIKIPKSTASYILRTLKQRGYLHMDEELGKYRISTKLFSVGSHALRGLEVHDVAYPLIQDLVEKTGLAGHLAILDGHEAVYIERIDKPGFIRINTWVGRRMDVHCTSVGKALIAHLPQETVEEIVRDRGMVKHTPKTITTLGHLLRELAHVRANGYAIDDCENNLDVVCIAAPIFNIEARTVAAVGLTGTESQMRSHKFESHVRLIKHAAKQISHQLGFTGAVHHAGHTERLEERRPG